jgi:hypothetical protein
MLDARELGERDGPAVIRATGQRSGSSSVMAVSLLRPVQRAELTGGDLWYRTAKIIPPNSGSGDQPATVRRSQRAAAGLRTDGVVFPNPITVQAGDPTPHLTCAAVGGNTEPLWEDFRPEVELNLLDESSGMPHQEQTLKT